jgi:hypothetical protein
MPGNPSTLTGSPVAYGGKPSFSTGLTATGSPTANSLLPSRTSLFDNSTIIRRVFMKRYLGFTKGLFLLVAPLIATSSFAISPSRAATLAISESEFTLGNFTDKPEIVGTLNQANTLLENNGGDVFAANNQGFNDFINVSNAPPEAFSTILSKTYGQDKSYFGLANSQARIVGNFDVNSGNIFAFDFTAFLNLETNIDEPSTEKARATGDISFFLLDTSNLSENNLTDFVAELLSDTANNIPKNALDYFSLNANLDNPGNNDFIVSQKSQNFIINKQFKQSNFGGNKKFAEASVEGYLERTFSKDTNVTLVALRRNQASVSVPEPSTYLGSVMFSVFLVCSVKAKRKNKILLASKR